MSYFDLARKDCVGTATGTASKVWYTVAGGVLSDTYEPTIDNTNVSTLQYRRPGRLHLRHARHRLCPGGNERMNRLFRLLQTGRIDPTPMTTHTFSFDDIGRAFTRRRPRRTGLSSR